MRFALLPFIWRTGPAHWPFNAVVGAASVLTLAAPVLTARLSLASLYALGVLVESLWLSIALWWCVCTFLTWVKPEPSRDVLRYVKWWLAPLLAIVLLDGHGARVVRFWTARPMMERELAAMVTRVGARALAEPAHFPQSFGNPFDHNGFARLPSPPPTEYDYIYTHIVGEWYMYFDP